MKKYIIPTMEFSYLLSDSSVMADVISTGQDGSFQYGDQGEYNFPTGRG